MGSIFISHVIDDEHLMREVAEGLEKAGYTSWFFERDVLPGASYLIQITQAMEECDAVVLLVTSTALSSDQVTKEVVGAFERSIPLVPVLVGVTPPELKECQPEWRHALGGTAMLCAEERDLSSTIPRVIEGLQALGIKPEETEVSTTASVPSIPRDISERILSSRSSLEGERKQVTVLFANVADFISLSEQLDPEEVHELITPAIEIMAQEIHTYEGTVAQFTGDGLMALFGAPLAHEDAPQRALYAALAMQRRLAEYGEKLKSKGISFQMRMGINTGLVIVGRIGDDLTMEYTTIGDTVNLASRMQSSAEPGTIQVAESTYHLAQGYFDFEDLGELAIKGKEKPVRAYRVLAPRAPRTRVEAALPLGLSAFVGRKKELEHLSDCYQLASEGQAQVVGIIGEPGVGKSRLIYEFRNSLPEEEYIHLEGGCLHYGEAIAYLPIMDILRNYFEISEGEYEADMREKIGRKVATLKGQPEYLLPPLQEVLSIAVDDEAYTKLDPQTRHQMVFDGMRQLFISESMNRPLIITIEDLQWIDKTSEEFLTYLIDSMATNRILLILCCRPEYRSPWTGKTYYSTVRVDQLPKKTSAQLVASILSGGEPDREITDLIVTKASGNPLFVEELTHGLLETGSIIKDNEHYALAGKPSDMQIPDTIQGIIAARLDRLEKNLKRVMQVASVIGREFPYRLLQQITGMEEELRSDLQSLQSLEFIYEKSLFPEPAYIFKHTLTQEVAYGSLLRKKRKELHAKIGDAIEQLYSERLEEHYERLAYHYAASDNEDKTLHYLELAGDKAVRSYANWEAIGLYKEAIRTLNTQAPSESNKKERLRVLRSMIDTLGILAYPQGSLDALQEAESLARELQDDRSLMAVYRRFSTYYVAVRDIALAMEYSRKCFEAAERVGDVDAMVMIATSTCQAQYYTGDVVDAAAMSSRALQLLEERHQEYRPSIGSWTIYSQLSFWCGISLASMGEFEEAKAVLDNGLRRSLEANDTLGKGWLEQGYCVLYIVEGDGKALVDHARRSIECFEETGIEVLLGVSWSFLGVGYCYLGELEMAREFAEKGLELQRETGVPIAVITCLFDSTLILTAAGDYENALRSAEEALELSQQSKARFWEGLALIMLGRVMGNADPANIEIAARHIKAGIARSEELNLRPYSPVGYIGLGEIYAMAGRREEAIENLKVAEKVGQEMGMGMGYWGTHVQELLARLEAGPEVS